MAAYPLLSPLISLLLLFMLVPCTANHEITPMGLPCRSVNLSTCISLSVLYLYLIVGKCARMTLLTQTSINSLEFLLFRVGIVGSGTSIHIDVEQYVVIVVNVSWNHCFVCLDDGLCAQKSMIPQHVTWICKFTLTIPSTTAFNDSLMNPSCVIMYSKYWKYPPGPEWVCVAVMSTFLWS